MFLVYMSMFDHVHKSHLRLTDHLWVFQSLRYALEKIGCDIKLMQFIVNVLTCKTNGMTFEVFGKFA